MWTRTRYLLSQNTTLQFGSLREEMAGFSAVPQIQNAPDASWVSPKNYRIGRKSVFEKNNCRWVTGSTLLHVAQEYFYKYFFFMSRFERIRQFLGETHDEPGALSICGTAQKPSISSLKNPNCKEQEFPARSSDSREHGIVLWNWFWLAQTRPERQWNSILMIPDQNKARCLQNFGKSRDSFCPSPNTTTESW